jgi:hypothetical protein
LSERRYAGAVDDQGFGGPSRAHLVLRRYRNTGWMIVAIGLIVPVLAAGGAYRGFRLWRWGRASDGLPLLLVGSAIFVARMALWASTGFRSAF